MWNWKPAKAVLDALWDSGRLVIAGRDKLLQRRYDLTERAIPKPLLEAEPPAEDETLRTLRCSPSVPGRPDRGCDPGALAPEGRQGPPASRPRRARRGRPAARSGRRRRRAPYTLDPDVEYDGAPAPPVLVCPFDNLVWDRPLLERLFGFRHVIEVYKREHEREYGYYVLPLLAGDRFSSGGRI